MTTFVPDYDLTRLRPAEYNPRYLSDDAFERLKQSIAKFGVIKPVIINGDGTLVAGHQRTKAMTALGITHAPVVVLDRKASLEDEINFNLTHNSIETIDAQVFVPPSEDRGYRYVDWQQIVVQGTGRARQISLCGKLVARHGLWGSVVVHPETGRVIANTDYAVVCARQRHQLLVYYPEPEHADEIEATMREDFGVYDASRVVSEPWGQYAIQPFRLAQAKSGRGSESVLYREDVIPAASKQERIVDFGAGRKAYVDKLAAEGYDILGYEPFLTKARAKGDRQFDIPQIVTDIVKIERRVRRAGLFDRVILDSVLNASTDDAYHLWITVCASALMHPNGALHIATRNLEFEERAAKSEGQGGGYVARIHYITPEKRSVAFRLNQWTTIKFHTPDTLSEWLDRFFADWQWTERSANAANLRTICRGPKLLPVDTVRAALEAEFNILYPDGYRHERHAGLVDAVCEAYLQTSSEREAHGVVDPAHLDLSN